MLIILLKILTFGYKYVLPLTFTTLIIIKWQSLKPDETRILMTLAAILFIRVENCFAPYRFYVKKSAYEYEITIFMATVKIVNLLETHAKTKGIQNWVFDIFLLCNIACYAFSFLVIILFVLIVICGLIGGDPWFLNVRRGLSAEELRKLKQGKWTEYNQSQTIDCPICLQELEPDNIVVQLPQCNHYFHLECIEMWLNTKPQCPSCRNNVRLALLAN